MYLAISEQYEEEKPTVFQVITGVFLAHSELIKLEPDIIEDNKSYYSQASLISKVKYQLSK